MEYAFNYFYTPYIEPDCSDSGRKTDIVYKHLVNLGIRLTVLLFQMNTSGMRLPMKFAYKEVMTFITFLLIIANNFAKYTSGR